MTTTAADFEITEDTTHGAVFVRRWSPSAPTRLAIVVHGYGEHSGRYEHVAEALAADGAAVYAPDHYGHGRSDGDRAVVSDIEQMVADLHVVATRAREEHPDLPVVMLGHSMGGLIATRYVQTQDHGLTALILSGAVVGGNPDIFALVEMPEIPEIPIDPAMLSRDPAVGEAYMADELVYHGPFVRETLEGFIIAVNAVKEGPGLGALPTLWIHGENDPLAPLAATREAMERLHGEDFEEHIYDGAMHEILNETNKHEVLADVAAFLGRAL